MHSTVLMRRHDILAVGGYRAIMPEDRDLWGRVVTSGKMIRCNPVPLVEYRLHAASETTRKMSPQEFGARRGVDLNIVRRMQNLPELSSDEVLALYNSRPLWVKLQDYRRRTAGINYRLAARHYSEGQWLRLTRRLAAAIALRPVYTVSRARRKLART